MRFTIGIFQCMFIGLCVITRGNDAHQPSSTLRNELLSKCDKAVRPVESNDEKVLVEITFRLMQILEVNVHLQYMKIAYTLRQDWHDYQLQWIPREYDYLSEVVLSTENFWTPDTTVYNDFDGAEPLIPGSVRVFHDGRISSSVDRSTKVLCPDMNASRFPFDRHKCGIKFGSWTYDGLNVDFILRNESHHSQNEFDYLYNESEDLPLSRNERNDGIDLSSFVQNPEWELTSLPSTYNTKHYNCCVEPYVDVIYGFTLRRISDTYIISLIVPLIFVVFLPVIILLLPNESGLKIQNSLFLLIILVATFSRMSPEYSDNPVYPIATRVLLLTTVNLVLTLGCNSVLLNLQSRALAISRKDCMIPGKLRNLAKITSRFVCLNWPPDSADDDTGMSTESDEPAAASKGIETSSEKEWETTLHVLERVIFTVFIVISVIGILIILF